MIDKNVHFGSSFDLYPEASVVAADGSGIHLFMLQQTEILVAFELLLVPKNRCS